MTKFNRFISLLLAVVVLFGAMPITSGAVVTDTYGGTTFERLCDLTINLNGGTLNDTTGALANVTNRKSPFNVKVYSAFASGYVGVPHTYNLLVGVPNDFCNTMTQFHTLLNNILSCTTRDGYKAVGFNFQGITTLYSPYSGTEVFAGELLQSDGSKYTMTIVWECTGEPHNYERTAYTAPTCTTDGSETYTCSKDNCGYSYTSTIAALGHSYTETKKATCTSSGTNVCSVCNTTTTISALGHDFGSWVNSGLGFYIYRCKRTEPSQCYSYNQKRFTVTYDANGGTPGSATTQTVEYSATNNTEIEFTTDAGAEPTRSGYTFKGWSTDNDAISGSTSITAGSNLTLYAVWEDASSAQYTLRLNAGEGEFSGNIKVKDYTISYGQTFISAIGTLPEPTRTGYTFGGFYYNDSFTLNSGNMGNTYELTTSVEITAVWTPITYTVTYKKNNTNADGTMAKSTFTYDVESALSANAFTRTGFSFAGWNTATDGTGTSYTDEQIVKNLKSTQDANLTLYAQWVRNTYTVEYDANGGGGTMESSTHSYGVSSTLTANAFERTGYTFSKWNTAPDGSGTGYANKASVSKLTTEPNGTVTLYAQWTPITYKVAYNKNGGSGTTMSNSTFTYDEAANLRANKYTKSGHAFAGWTTNSDGTGTFYKDGQSVMNLTATSGATVTLYAYWAPIYTMTLEPGDGTLSSDFSTTYSVYYGQPLKDVCSFPQAELNGWYVDYWECYNGEQYIGKYTESDWESKAYYANFNATMKAHYAPSGDSEFTIKFLASSPGSAKTVYDFYTITDGEPKCTVSEFNSSNATFANGSNQYSITIKVNDYFSTKGDFPVAECGNYIVDYWFGEYTAPDGTTSLAKIDREMWATGAFDKGVNLELYAIYTCNHQKFGYNWNFKFTVNGQEYIYDEGHHSSPLNPGNVDTRPYFRHEGVCKKCEQIAAFGYNVHFLAQNNDAYAVYGGPDILLSAGVPLEDLYTIKNGGYSAEKGFVIDYLEDGLNPEVTIHFDPILKAAKSSTGFKCWVVDYTKFGHREGDKKNFDLTANLETGLYTWTFDYRDMSFDGGLHSCHLRLVAEYEDDYHELLFNAAGGLDPNVYQSSAGFVDSGYKYGVVPIQYGQAYRDVLNYSPTAKHIASYTDINKEYFGYNSKFKYTRAVDTLYCSVSWKYVYTGGVFILNAKNFIEGETYGIDGDGVYVANYLTDSIPEMGNDGVAQGSLATVYANNKGADTKYNKAYFDVNENTGGTMYYRYYSVTVKEEVNGQTVDVVKWKCEPLFAYNPVTDYTNALKCYPADDPELYTELYGDEKTVYFQIEDDFSYKDYIDKGFTNIIAKEPKRYTYYMGDGAYYVFPTVCNTPDGQPYQAYSSTPVGATGLNDGVTKDPQIMDKYVASDANGYSYFLDVDDNSGNTSNFRLARCDSGYPIFSQYTTHVTLESYLAGTDVDSMPLGYCAMHTNCNVHGDITGTTNRPYAGPGGSNHNYAPAYGYEDFGTHYGDGLRLSYPDGDDVTIFDCSVKDYNSNNQEVTVTVDMQAAYYASWEFMIKFNSNYPQGKTANEVGFPTSVNGKTTADGTVINSADIQPVNNNYTVYQYASFWSPTVMPGLKLFSCNGYYIDSWQLYDANGQATSYTLKAITLSDYNKLTNKEKADYSMSAYNAFLYANEPGAEFRAVWKRLVTFTLVDGVSGLDSTDDYATITYTDIYSDEPKTRTAKGGETVIIYNLVFGSSVTVSDYDCAENNRFAYLTLNNNKFNLIADRIISNKSSYSFHIVDDTTMTAQFVAANSANRLYLDRNNTLLSSSNDPWKLYSGLPTRAPLGIVTEAENNTSYYTYKDDITVVNNNVTTTYTVTVMNSTYKDLNKNYTFAYDEVITLMTAPVNSSSQKFVGWKIGNNYVSHDAVYEHRVTSTVTVNAVYNNTDTSQPTVSIIKSETDSNSNRDIFVSQYWLPQNCQLIETGYIITSSPDSDITFDDLYTAAGEPNTNYSKIVSTNTDNSGNFKLLLPNKNGLYYAVAYISYIDKNNLVHVKYSARDTQ